MTLVLSALFFGLRSVFQNECRRLSRVVMLGGLCATLLLMASIAVGRSRHEVWVGGADMHFGYLIIMMPIIAWIIVSTDIGRKSRIVVGVILVSVFVCAYLENSVWRYRYTAETEVQHYHIQQQLATSIEPQTIANMYIKDFFFVDDLPTRAAVAHGISLLRQYGGEQYRTTH